MRWQIVCKPTGDYPLRRADEGEDENRSHMEVTLTNGAFVETVCRVGFARRNTKNPDVLFKTQLDTDVENARTAVKLLNDQLAPAPDGELV